MRSSALRERQNPSRASDELASSSDNGEDGVNAPALRENQHCRFHAKAPPPGFRDEGMAIPRPRPADLPHGPRRQAPERRLDVGAAPLV
jgi:hypothetical protein